jgi:hypothetical protein
MADITITAASVVPGASASQVAGIAGETITAGMAVYYATGTQLWMKALANGTAAQSGSGVQYGIALTSSSLNQPIMVDVNDPNGITIGGTTVVGTVYVVSAAAAGGICPWADLASTNYVTILGVGKSSNRIQFVSDGATGIIHA